MVAKTEGQRLEVDSTRAFSEIKMQKRELKRKTEREEDEGKMLNRTYKMLLSGVRLSTTTTEEEEEKSDGRKKREEEKEGVADSAPCRRLQAFSSHSQPVGFSYLIILANQKHHTP